MVLFRPPAAIAPIEPLIPRYLLASFVAWLPLLVACSGQRTAEQAAPGASAGAPVPAGQRPPVVAPREAAPRSRAAERKVSASEGTPSTRILFIGNSFTLQGPVPDLVARFARDSGFVNVVVDFRAVSGQSLAWHRGDPSPAGAPARLREGWDVVVLQDFSTRPTDALGEPAAFKDDVSWFYERAKEANPAVRVVLYETWARRAGHPLYGVAFASPAQMQAQLRRHYTDAAEHYIPRFATVAPGESVGVAPVGDAWELQLGRNADLRLHAPDDYHASVAGQYLSAAVLFSTIFDRPAAGLPALHVAPPVAAALQATADQVTGHGEKTAPAEDAPDQSSFNAV